MNKLVREILILFVIIVFANMMSEIGEEQKIYLTKPLKFFGGAFISSIIGGFIMYKINTLFKNNRS